VLEYIRQSPKTHSQQMLFHNTAFPEESPSKEDKFMRSYVFNGIVNQWQANPAARKRTIESKTFPMKFEEVGLLGGHYELEREDLPYLFVFFKTCGAKVPSDSTVEERLKNSKEQQMIFDFLKKTIRSHEMENNTLKKAIKAWKGI